MSFFFLVLLITLSSRERMNVWLSNTDDSYVHSASSLGMMSDEEKKLQRIEDIKELLS